MGKASIPFNETEARRIAAVHILVERVIGRVNNFHILKASLPITMSADLNKIWIVAATYQTFYPLCM